MTKQTEIYQYRWYDDKNIRWEKWSDINFHKYQETLQYIKKGYKYQVRILKPTFTFGYDIKQ